MSAPPRRISVAYDGMLAMKECRSCLSAPAPGYRYNRDASLQHSTLGFALMLDVTHGFHRGPADPVGTHLDLDTGHPSVLFKELDSHNPRPLAILAV